MLHAGTNGKKETMNLILLQVTDFIEGTTRVQLDGRRLRHIREVHRASIGDELCVGLAGGLIGTGVVTSSAETLVEMEVCLERRPPQMLPVTLVLALPRPKVLKRVLIGAASMGVKKIILIHSFRVEKSYWQSPALQEENVEKQLILGLEQARDTVMPEVLLRNRFKPFVEDELPVIIQHTLPVLADPSGPVPCPREVGGPVTLAVGPEGGFTAYEVEKLLTIGFSAVTMGERILRVETAVPVLLSRLF
jgi:16S rRNA (uracil1498-N3)-methyltransferase